MKTQSVLTRKLLRFNIVSALVVLLTGVSWLATPTAHAAFSLDALDYYGILINSGVKNAEINTFPVNANIGVGEISGDLNLHNGTINGMVDFYKDSTGHISGGNIKGTQPVELGGAPTPARINSNVTQVQTAIDAALLLSSTYGASTELANATPVTIAGPTTINASAGWLDSSGTRIFKASSFSIGNHNTVTINGTVNDYVVINVTGASGNKLDGTLALNGGITSDHVLINFLGSGGELKGAANGATLEGTFLVPDLKVNVNSLNLYGHLFGGASGQDFQFVSNAMIDQPDLLPPVSPVPIPGTAILMLSGLVLLAGTALLRRRDC